MCVLLCCLLKNVAFVAVVASTFVVVDDDDVGFVVADNGVWSFVGVVVHDKLG